ncbi:MAG: winged helix-turn-helix domain-containing protein, partial [Alphaproteobacteria bacterium]|nr:winged helix-turn-helix domain-containing protein [Alphaproteobacteria bacterium]
MARTFIIKANKLPNMPAMMVRTVQALVELGGSASISELDDKVSELEGVTEDELTLLMNNDKRPRFNYFCAWTRTFLKKADIATNSTRGVWVLSSKKFQEFDLKTAEETYKKINKQETYKSKKRAEAKNQNSEIEEILEDEANEWKQHLLNAVSSMTASDFEKLSQRLLREAGFIRVEVRGQSGDGGIDGVGILRM